MTYEELQAIKVRWEASSAGVWEIHVETSRDRTGIPTYFAWAETPTIEADDLTVAVDQASADAEFACSAHNADVPALFAEIERLWALVNAVPEYAAHYSAKSRLLFNNDGFPISFEAWYAREYAEGAE